MANDWTANLGDPEAFAGLPYPASPYTAAGQDPDEIRAQMGLGGAGLPGQNIRAVPSAPAARPAVAPAPVPASAPAAASSAPGPAAPQVIEPWMTDAAQRGLAGTLSSGDRLMQTGDQMQDDPNIANLQEKKLEDESAQPNVANYKPGFGTRLVRGLKAAGLGLAEGGIFGAATGAIDPALVRGGTAYGAPTDAYDTALAANKQKVGQDTEQLANAQENFKRAQELRAAREKAFNESGERYGAATTGAGDIEGKATEASKVPIEQENADTTRQKVFNESPEGKLQITQQQIDTRTAQADRMGMPHGYGRTRYILTGEIQPAREPGAEEIAVNNVLRGFIADHAGKGPQTVADWQAVYAAAKGGEKSGATGDTKNLREAASLAEKHLKLLKDNKARYSVIWSDEDRKQNDQEIADAQSRYDDLQRQLTAAPGAAGGTGAPQTFKPGKDGMVRMKLPDGRIARFKPENARAAANAGAVAAPEGQ